MAPTPKAQIVPPSSFSEPSEPSQLKPEDKPESLLGQQEENPQLIAHRPGNGTNRTHDDEEARERELAGEELKEARDLEVGSSDDDEGIVGSVKRKLGVIASKL